jgi:hypothetical protein
MRTLMGLLSCLFVLASGSLLTADQAEDKAVALIQKLGGKIERDDKRAGSPVVTIDLKSQKIKDADLACLADLREVTSLKLDNTGLTDEGLKHLQGLKNLRRLTVSFTGVSDEGLKLLKGLDKLEYLHVGYCAKVTAKGKAELRQALPKLEIFGP